MAKLTSLRKETSIGYLLMIIMICYGSLQAQTNGHYSVTSYDLNYHKSVAIPPPFVFVCRSGGVYRYHLSDTCRAYVDCKNIEPKICILDATKRGYMPCKICKPY